MKNLMCLLLMGLIITSCSQDDLLNDQSADLKVELATGSYDLTNYGIYKGTFAANSSALRGTILVMANKSGAKASLSLIDGKEIKFTANNTFTSRLTSQSIRFESEAGSFVFNVNANGSDPIVSEVNVLQLQGDIVLVKETSTIPVKAITGTFGCVDCGGHPVLSNPDMQDLLVWNLIFSGDGTGSDVVTTQVNWGTSTFTGTGIQESPFVQEGTMSWSNVTGEYRLGTSSLISWKAIHSYSLALDCNDVEGTWKYTTPRYDIEGWLRSDSRCNLIDSEPDYTYCNDAQTKAIICHNDLSLCVSVNAIAAHLAHGDSLGTCD